MRLALRNTTFTRNYLHSVLNSMTDAVFVTAPGGVIRIANEAASRLTGYDGGELIGMNLTSLLEQSDKAGPDPLPLAREAGETVLRTRTGQTIPVSFVGSTIATDDPAIRGRDLRRARHHRAQARRAAHPLSGPLRRADQDSQSHAVPASAAAGDRALRGATATAWRCCTSTWIVSRRSTTPSAMPPVIACSKC